MVLDQREPIESAKRSAVHADRKNPLNEQARDLINTSDKNTFVKIEAGQQAYVMVTDLPGSVEGADAPG